MKFKDGRTFGGLYLPKLAWETCTKVFVLLNLVMALPDVLDNFESILFVYLMDLYLQNGDVDLFVVLIN